jgi:hypothetical protein
MTHKNLRKMEYSIIINPAAGERGCKIQETPEYYRIKKNNDF